MEQTKMTIHRALSELKLIDSKIQKEINSAAFIGINQKDRLINDHVKPEDYSKAANSSYDSITALIARKSAIKKAIVDSNSTTKVIVAGKEMVVAEAITYKAHLPVRKHLAEVMLAQYNKATSTLNKMNEQAKLKADSIAEASLGKEGVKTGKEDYDNIVKPYLEKNEYHLFDPIKLKDKIDALSAEIMEFEAEVDAALSEINATTFIIV